MKRQELEQQMCFPRQLPEWRKPGFPVLVAPEPQWGQDSLQELQAKYEADTKQRWIDGRRQREKAGEVGGAASGGAISGAGSGGRSEDDLLYDPRTPIETVNKILARRNGG